MLPIANSFALNSFLPYQHTIDIFTIPSSANCAGFTYCRRLLLLLLLVLSGAFPLALDNENGTATTTTTAAGWNSSAKRKQWHPTFGHTTHTAHSTQHTQKSLIRPVGPLARWHCLASAGSSSVVCCSVCCVVVVGFSFLWPHVALALSFCIMACGKTFDFLAFKRKNSSNSSSKKKTTQQQQQQTANYFYFCCKENESEKCNNTADSGTDSAQLVRNLCACLMKTHGGGGGKEGQLQRDFVLLLQIAQAHPRD